MRLRFESKLLSSQFPTSAPLALTTLARLAKSGVLPAGTRATDALSPEVAAKFAQLRPNESVPADVAELVMAFSGDLDTDGRLDVDLEGLSQTGFFTLDVAAITRASALPITADEFVAVAADHARLLPAVDGAPLAQQSIYEEVEETVPSAAGLVQWIKSEGRTTLHLTTPLLVDEKGAITQGSPDGTKRAYENISLELSDYGVQLSAWGTAGMTYFFAAASGRIKEYDPHIGLKPGGTEADAGKWLLDTLLETVRTARADPTLEKLFTTRDAQTALRARTSPPKDLAERAVWAGGRVRGDELQSRVTTLTEQWGVRPLRWQGWLDDVSEVNTARAILEATGGQTSIRPSYLYTVAIGEGLPSYLDANSTYSAVDTSKPVSGFSDLGTDTFATAAADLKRRGFLPEWFQEGRDYTVTSHVNEKGENVQSADFPDLKRGLIALRAMLADCRSRFQRDARAVLGASAASRLTQDQLDYYTYVYFNAGAGFGRKHLQANGLGAVAKWDAPPPADNRIARYNAIQRLSTQKLMDSLGLFPARSTMPAPTLTPVVS